MQWVLAIVLAVCTAATMGSIRVCPVNKLQFLSYSNALLPRENVQASSEDEEYNPLGNFITDQTTQPWCSDLYTVNTENLHINLTFTEPVVIAFLESSGYYNAYVNSFSFQHAMGTEGDALMPYGVLEESQVFHVDITELQSTYISLERQLVTQRLMLNIHSSVFEDSNRSCWKLRILGCTLQEAMPIPGVEEVEEEEEEEGEEEEEEEGEPNESTPCPIAIDGEMMARSTTIHPEPTGLPSEPCTTATSTDSAESTERIMTVLVPVAVLVVVLCALMVGIGILCCHIIVARKSGKRPTYHSGVSVKELGQRNVPVPMEPGNTKAIVVNNGTTPSQKGSVCSDIDYDMPRATMYDVPRTPPQRPRTGTTSSNEYKNPIYDGASNKESNTYESIPFDLEKTGQRTRAGSEGVLRPEAPTGRASDVRPHSQRMTGQDDMVPQAAMHSSDPQMVQYSVVDKSKKKPKDPLPVFEVLYDRRNEPVAP